MDNKLPSSKILGIKVTTATKSEILDFIITGLKNKGKKFYIVTPNPEMLVYSSSSSSYKSILNKAEVSLPDGIGVVISGNILKSGIKERITGVDMIDDIAAKCAKEALSIGLLGGSRGVAEKACECLIKKHPHLRVSFVSEEWGREGFENAKKYGSGKEHIDILFVAFGFPKQEEWIANNLDKIPATAAMGVGGAFDFISGKIPRAPRIVRSFGFEWLFRLVIQPWRIKRQLALPRFVIMVLKEKFS